MNKKREKETAQEVPVQEQSKYKFTVDDISIILSIIGIVMAIASLIINP
ncbi:MAG: hypothetical protein ACRC68_10195 [Clostridium sp.]